MSKIQCTKCEEELTEKDAVICDGCNDMVHEKCSSLASSELRAIMIQKRSLFYFCLACKNAFKQIPTLVNKIKQLSEINETLRRENRMLNERLNENASIQGINNFEIIQEIQERQKRASNLVVHNIKESGKKTMQERRIDDTDTMKQILSSINNDVMIKKTFRLGKYVAGKNRPIKVILNNPDEALKILKNKNKVRMRIPGINIYGDQTKMQQSYYLSVKEELHMRTERGEDNLRIKYINGVPKIIIDNGPSNSQKN